MIKCKMHQDDQERISFDAEITGVSQDILVELMKINAILIRNFRQCGIVDEEIEEQLVNCVAGGFKLEESH